MDNSNQQRRQNEPPIHQTPAHRFSLQAHPSAGGSAERFRPAPPLSASPPASRGIGGAASYSSYYPEPTAAGFSTSTNMPPAALGYGSEYDTRSQTQGFGGYNAGMMMYNVPQPSTQTPVYDAQQFGQRQQATMQMMASDVASTYFSPEAGAAAATAASGNIQQPAQGSGTSAGIYQQNTTVNYSGGSMPSTSTMQQASGATEGSMSQGQGQGQDYGASELQEKWISYQRQLGSVFQDISGVFLERAAETLLGVSSWLLSQVAELGLSQDDSSLHADRLKLWNDFNHAWLALGFRQKEMMMSRQQLSRSQTLMSHATIKKMGTELIQLCDGIERHGLVDYQYGVWEEQIETIFEECLDLSESAEESAGGGGGAR